MKGKQLLLLLVLVGALGYAGWLAFRGNRESWSQTGGGAGGKVLELPLNDVAQVQMKTASSEVNLVKGETWTVKERADYPANYEQVSELLRKLWDLKTVQAQKVGPSQLGRLELVEPGKGDPAGTLLDFKDKDGKSLAALLLGKKHMRKSEGGMGDEGGFPAGRYVMPLGEKAQVSLVSETFEQYEARPERWLLKDFVKVENPKSIVLAGETDALKWSVARDSATAEWKLTDAKGDEKIDSSKASPLSSAFGSPSFKDVLAPDAKPAETGLDKPAKVTIQTFDGFTYTLEIGKVKDEAYPVRLAVSGQFAKERTPGKDEKPEDKTKLDDEFKATLKKHEDKLAAEKKFETRTYLLEKYTVDSLLKERSTLLAEKKPETPPAAAIPPTPAAQPAPITVTTPPVSVPDLVPPVPAPPADPSKPMPLTPPAASTPKPKPAPITVTTPPVSVPAAVSPPVAVPPEAPKPMPTAPPPAPPPAKPAPGTAPSDPPPATPPPANLPPPPAPADGSQPPKP